MKRTSFSKKRTIHAFVLIFILIMIILIASLLMFKYHVEGETNLPFELKKINVISTAESSITQDEEDIWHAGILQKNDIFFVIEKNSEYKKIEVWIRLQSLPVLEPYKDKLEQIFLLHEALKAERNSSNHASEKGVRIPYKVVTRAINIYTYMLKDIMEICRKEKDA